MPSVETRLRVRYAETDQMGVAYHAHYLVWCEIGRTDFMRAHGMSYADMERSGIRLAVSEASIRYHAAARYDDAVRVETRLADVRSRAVTFDYLLTRTSDGTRLATARTTLVALDGDGRPAALPAPIRAQLGTARG
jgi:acyl-CoA thioester hydrolase